MYSNEKDEKDYLTISRGVGFASLCVLDQVPNPLPRLGQ